MANLKLNRTTPTHSTQTNSPLISQIPTKPSNYTHVYFFKHYLPPPPNLLGIHSSHYHKYKNSNLNIEMNTNKTQESQESNTLTPKTPLNTKPPHKLNSTDTYNFTNISTACRRHLPKPNLDQPPHSICPRSHAKKANRRFPA